MSPHARAHTVLNSSNGAGTRPAASKALVFLPDLEYFGLFEPVIRAMLAAGNQVVLALDDARRERGSRASTPAGLAKREPAFEWHTLGRRTGLWRIPARAIRRSLDYMRYLEPRYADAGPLRDRARDSAPPPLRVLLWLPPFRWDWGRRGLAWLLRRLEAGLPIPRNVTSFIAEQSPSLVIVSPLVEMGSDQADHLRAAALARVPTVFVVAGWDDLTSEGRLRDAPTLTVVGNDVQVDEAIRFHGLDADRVVAVGTESVDGLEVPAATATARAATATAGAEVMPPRAGRLLRPVLWLLTPLLAIVLPLLRPVSTARAVRRRVRKWRRDRARAEKVARAEAKRARRAAALEAKQEKRAKTEQGNREKAGQESTI